MKKLIILVIVLLLLPVVLAVVKDYTIITCEDVGCSKKNGICRDDGFCYYLNGSKERRSCVEVPESCLESEDRLCYTGRDYPICLFLKDKIIVMRDKEETDFKETTYSFENKVIFGDRKIDSNKPRFICEPREITSTGGNCKTVQYQCNQNEDCIFIDNEYKCRDDERSDWNSPNPNKDCWISAILFDGKSFTMKYNDEISLNDYLKLKLIISGHYEGDEDRVDRYSNTLILTIIKDFLSLNHLDDKKYFIIKDSNEKLCFNTNNKLANFNSNQAGFYVVQITDLVTTEKRFSKFNEIKIGDNIYCVDIDTSMYGEIEYTIFAFTSFGDNKYFDNEKLIFRYKIVDKENIPEDAETVEENNSSIIEYIGTECMADNECSAKNLIGRCVNNKCVYEKSYLWIVLVSVIIIIIFVLFYIIKKIGGK